MQRRSFIAAAYAFFVIMMGTTLPTPLYAIYQEKFHFSALMITLLFAIYALVVVAALLIFGRLSDEVGRKPVLLLAGIAAALSAIAFLVADGVAMMFAGRILSGVSAGLVTGTATAALLDYGGQANRGRSATIAVAVNAAGLGFGTAFAGVLAEWFADPLYLPFFVDFGLTVVAIAVLLLLPSKEGGRSWRLQLQKPSVPAEVRSVFARAALAAGSGFAVTGVLTAVVSLFLVGHLNNTNHATAGGVVGIALVSVAFGQLIVKRLSDSTALPVGCAGLFVASALIGNALLADSLWSLVTGAVFSGLGTGICTGAGLREIGTKVDPHQRAAASSTFFAVLYVMLSVPVIAVGVLVELTDLVTAGVTFSVAVALVSIGVFLSQLRPSRS